MKMDAHRPGPGGWQQLSLEDAVGDAVETCIPGDNQGWTDQELTELTETTEQERTADRTDRKDDAEGGEE